MPTATDPYETKPEPTSEWLARTFRKGIWGVYFLWKSGDLVYIGRSNNVRDRVKRHIKTKDFDSVSEIATTDERRLETYLIRKYNPPLNGVPNHIARRGMERNQP